MERIEQKRSIKRSLEDENKRLFKRTLQKPKRTYWNLGMRSIKY